MTKKHRIGVIGYGHLGKFLVNELNKLDDFEIVRIWNRSANDEKRILPLEAITVENLQDIDLVVEVAHPMINQQFGEMILDHCDLFIGSPTCLADTNLLSTLQTAAKDNNRRVLVAAGALWGAGDIQKMSRKGILESLTITMIKHPSSFKLESPLKEVNEIAKQEIEKATVLYEGPIVDLCSWAPNNVNTMASAAIAAPHLGFQKVIGRLISDPKMVDWHIVEVEAIGPDGFCVKTTRKNPAKPGAVTGQLTYYSFLASIEDSIYKPVGMHIC